MNKQDFTHFHVHTEYSFLDGYNRIDNMIEKVKELGMDAISITDHGTLAGVYTFHKKCRENNIKPIIGCELYYTHDTSKITLDKKERDAIAWENALEYFKKENIEIKTSKLKATEKKEIIKEFGYDTKSYHIILIARNNNGWKNLCKLVSESSRLGTFNGKAHCDLELLKKYNKDIICCTACMASYSSSLILKDNLLKAKEYILQLKNIFGEDRLFLEIQPLDDYRQLKINKALIDFSKELNLKLIATNDVHYTNKEDHFEHDVLLCVGTKKLLKDTNRLKYANEFWIRTYDEMFEAFKRTLVEDDYNKYISSALANTRFLKKTISDDIILKSDKPLLPDIDIPNDMTDDNYLTILCWTKLYKYLKNNNLMDKREIYEKRLQEELNVIITKGFSSYILTVDDAIKQSSFGPGRGSGAGSLAMFLLGIVKGTDPIEYGLLFSRFLTMDRTSPPDVDSDVSRDTRQDLIYYLNKKYGIDSTSQVGTITVLGVKSGIKDIARVFDIPATEANKITKRIDAIYNEPGMTFKTLDDLEENDPEGYKQFKELENEYKDIFTIARHFEGIPRNMGIHAGGVLITPGKVNDYFPTKIVEGKKVTMWDKDIVEEAGGVKFDFLGLKTISIIETCLKYIKETSGIEMTLQDLYENKNIRTDPDIFDMICATNTSCVFQMESKLFKMLIKSIQPRTLKDLIAITSMARPGPLSAHMDKKYVENKEGEISYPIRGVEDILEETYGTILYQEQIMLIAKKIAGFNDNQADTYLRKALAKKKIKIMNLCKEWLIYGKPEKDKYGDPIKGAINNGYTEKELLNFWHDLEGYASYLFNKSHATSYSLLTVITAYLKHYFPTEYYAAVLSYDEKDDKKIHIDAAKEEFGIDVVIPSINEIKENFYPIPKENKILYGLASISGVGEKCINDILNNKPYKNIEDMINKIPKKSFNKSVAEAITLSGLLDFDNKDRAETINRFYKIKKSKAEPLEKLKRKDIINYERKYLEANFSIKPWFDKYKNEDKIEAEFKIKNVQERLDRKGQLMAFVTVEDPLEETGDLTLIVFSYVYLKYIDAFDLTFGNKISIKGKKDDQKIIVSSATKISEFNV